RHRRDDRGRLELPHCENGRLERRAGREAVVDEDHDAAADVGDVTSAAEDADPALELRALADGHLFDLRVRDVQRLDQLAAEDLRAAGGNRAHRELGITWDAELADD